MKKYENNRAAATVWKLPDDDEFINEDDLLDEKDKTKPNPTNLKGIREKCIQQNV